MALMRRVRLPFDFAGSRSSGTTVNAQQKHERIAEFFDLEHAAAARAVARSGRARRNHASNRQRPGLPLRFRSLAACLLAAVTASQSCAAIASGLSIQEPPTQTTLGSAR